MKCKYCDGSGEVRGISHGYEDDGIEGCPCCKGDGEVTKKRYDQFIKSESEGDEE